MSELDIIHSRGVRNIIQKYMELDAISEKRQHVSSSNHSTISSAVLVLAMLLFLFSAIHPNKSYWLLITVYWWHYTEIRRTSDQRPVQQTWIRRQRSVFGKVCAIIISFLFSCLSSCMILISLVYCCCRNLSGRHSTSRSIIRKILKLKPGFMMTKIR